MRNPIRRLLILLFVLLIGACGFQPRGTQPSLGALSPLQISGLDRFDPLHPELERALQQAGIELTTDGDGNRLLISDRVRSREVLTTNIRNRAVEYQLEESLRYRLQPAGTGQAGEPRLVRVERILYDPGTHLLAKRHEEDTLRAEMRQQLIRQLLAQLAAGG